MAPEPYQAPTEEYTHRDCDLDPLLDLILVILRAHPQGLKEYDLLKRLALEDDTPFTGRLHDELEMFRQHFLLFHLLYRLRDRLRVAGEADVHIHCLRIGLLPFSRSHEHAARRQVAPDDPLRNYYLDWRNCEAVDRDTVRRMIQAFWKRYHVTLGREEALEVFGLPRFAGPAEIKRRYRELVRRTHPDMGGDPDEFRRVMSAAGALLS
ncbi:J domain-containing protein [Sulfidibacter corallicola]|uniref:J domain-containing protein n=1 Tax=Sulfidibacter corallicola TaxID=2818388 RepID=A0A8A4TYJ1_SULCO|nr:DNA-J related domain-containing protein [Sulfidibacter corallicola]QTD51595.1 hypothetical protein J3U87_03920 [Sulfidibacter corallicola]